MKLQNDLSWLSEVLNLIDSLCTVAYFLITDPEYQRRGLGARLLNVGLDLADAEGKKSYIEATSEGHPLYLKLGWRDVDRFDVDFNKYGGERPGTTWIMMRDPQPVQVI